VIIVTLFLTNEEKITKLILSEKDKTRKEKPIHFTDRFNGIGVRHQRWTLLLVCPPLEDNPLLSIMSTPTGQLSTNGVRHQNSCTQIVTPK
jgi:hypothetical protein